MITEGNWLHQILFRGFIAKGVNTYALTTFPFFTIFFSFHFTNLGYTNKNEFKLQVVMQQNRKKAKGDEYFCKALYVVVPPSYIKMNALTVSRSGEECLLYY